MKRFTLAKARLEEQIEQLRVQLAGCSTAAMGFTKQKDAAKRGDYGWSPSYQDVLELRRRYDRMLRRQSKRDARSEAKSRKRTTGSKGPRRASGKSQ